MLPFFQQSTLSTGRSPLSPIPSFLFSGWWPSQGAGIMKAEFRSNYYYSSMYFLLSQCHVLRTGFTLTVLKTFVFQTSHDRVSCIFLLANQPPAIFISEIHAVVASMAMHGTREDPCGKTRDGEQNADKSVPMSEESPPSYIKQPHLYAQQNPQHHPQLQNHPGYNPQQVDPWIY